MGHIRKDSGKFSIALALFLGATVLAATSARASDSVTYVESVDCVAGACTARHKTEPVNRTVRERHAGNMCVEFTRSIAGMKKVPTVDPNTPIELPQYQDSPSRFVRCDQAASADNARVAALDVRTRQ